MNIDIEKEIKKNFTLSVASSVQYEFLEKNYSKSCKIKVIYFFLPGLWLHSNSWLANL